MSETLETPYEPGSIQQHLNLEQRARFIKLESARATARAGWMAYAYGWRIMPTAETRYDGRTSLGTTSPAGGVRYMTWQQPTLDGRFEVTLYETDLEAALKCSLRLEEHMFELCSQRFGIPRDLEMWHMLAQVACKYVML
jgi:hypothetical protein